MKKLIVLLPVIFLGSLSFAKTDKPAERLPTSINEFKELSSDVSRTLSVLWETCRNHSLLRVIAKY